MLAKECVLIMTSFSCLFLFNNENVFVYSIEQKISFEQGQELADEFGVMFFESSAKLNLNVSEVFFAAANVAVSEMKKDPKFSSKASAKSQLDLNNQSGNTKKNGCC